MEATASLAKAGLGCSDMAATAPWDPLKPPMTRPLARSWRSTLALPSPVIMVLRGGRGGGCVCMYVGIWRSWSGVVWVFFRFSRL